MQRGGATAKGKGLGVAEAGAVGLASPALREPTSRRLKTAATGMEAGESASERTIYRAPTKPNRGLADEPCGEHGGEVGCWPRIRNAS